LREYTIQEVIEYAQGIEEESFRFYRKAAGILDDAGTVGLVEGLAVEEERHYNQLRTLLDPASATAEELAVRITLDVEEPVEGVVAAVEISADATPREILDITLSREKRTERLYGMLLRLTDLNETMVQVFDDLRKFEQRHVERVTAMIGRL